MGGEDDAATAPLEGPARSPATPAAASACAAAQASVDVWVAEDVPAGPGVFADFLEWSGAAQALGGLVAAVRELPGFPLETRTRVSVLGETQETIVDRHAIRVGPQPAELFEVPAGWRVLREKP